KIRHALECLQQKALSLMVPLILDTVGDESSYVQDNLFFSGRRRPHVVARRIQDFRVTVPPFPNPVCGVTRNSDNRRIRIDDIVNRVWEHAHEDPASSWTRQCARVAIIDKQIEFECAELTFMVKCNLTAAYSGKDA